MTATTLRLLLLCAALLVGGGQAFAQSCTMAVTGVNFGSVNLLSGAAYDQTATLTATCTNSTTLGLFVRICPNINAGAGGANGDIRQMQNTALQTLDFQLYQDSARTVKWGSVTQTQFGAPPPIDLFLLSGATASANPTTVYARVLANQQATLGGPYSSLFSGANTRFNYKSYVAVAPACNTMTDNPTQVPFNVQANVDRTCNVTAQNITFGNRGVLTAAINAPGGLSVTCTLNLPYSISLDGGTSGATSPTQRKMVLNGASVIYGLYQDAARTVPWGTAVGQIVTGTGTGAVQNLPIYGRVEAQATPAPGTYTDTVVATVTY